jgi:predicted nucleic acid-binding protein
VILVDTNVWIDHLKRKDPRLARLLEDDLVLVHPWIKGELALGTMADRLGFLKLLDYLPELTAARDTAVLDLIESAALHGRGIGWVDAGLLASCIARPCLIWSRDRRLSAVARELGIAPEA